MKKSFILLLSGLLVTTSPITAIANGSVVTKVNMINKQEYMNYIKSDVNISYLHNVGSVHEWAVDDFKYIEENNNIDYKKEIGELHSLLSIDREDYVITPNKTRIYGHKQTEKIDVLIDAINIRWNKLGKNVIYNSKKATIGSNSYSILDKTNFKSVNSSSIDKLANEIFEDLRSLPSEQELMEVAEAVYDVLFTYKLPDGVSRNLDMFLSPYYLDGYRGFSYSKGLDGREEEIIIAPSISGNTRQNALDTVLHELGHIFMFDVLGVKLETYSKPFTGSVSLWVELEDMYSELNKAEMEYILCESFAEHFRIQMSIDNNLKYVVNDKYPLKEEVLKYINNKISNYKPSIEKSVTSLSINGYAVINNYLGFRPMLCFDEGEITFDLGDWDLDKNPVYLKLLKKDEKTDSAIFIEDGYKIENSQVSFNLDKGEYVVHLYVNNDCLYRFNEFIVE